MKPRKYQQEMADEGYNILRRFMMVYLAAEERTGKTLPAIMIAEKCDNIKSVLVLTKKNAVKGWKTTLSQYPHSKKYNVTNYHQVHKFGKHDLLILDEAHNYIAGYPKQSNMHKQIQEIAKQTPIIYLSATPYAQGFQMLYHQFALSSWSPWRKYKDFYSWFRTYGIPDNAWFNGRQVPVYTKTKGELIKPEVEHLFITKTRKELGFEHEPEDKLHYFELKPTTRKAYNYLMKDKYLNLGRHELICDTPMKLRTSLHMLEGGAAKIDGEYLILPNTEKIDYIKKVWGDTKDLVIFYHYIAEGQKLRQHFKHAQILQATSYAEGIDLAHVETIVVYSQDFSTAKHTQRRARQAAKHRDKPIVVHFLLVKKAVSEQVYFTVSVNKQNFVDSVFERNYL
jgi:hypothetical protein